MLRAPFRFRQIPYSSPTFTTVTLRRFNYHGHMEGTEQIIKSGQAEAVDEIQEEPKRGTRFEAKIIKTSRTVSYILRHGAKREGLSMRPDGYVKVEDLLRHKKLSALGFMELEQMVKEDEKGRYNLSFEPAPPSWRKGTDLNTGPIWWIRANQGHSIQEVEVEMTPVTDPSQCPVVIHGTSKRAWESIRKQGLSKMDRNHIHFAQGLPGAIGVVSGMRKNADILIFVDMTKALTDNYKFFISQNGVVLCAGNESGFLPTKYFFRVETAWKNYAVPGYEGERERSGSEKLEDFDEKHGANMKKLGIRTRRKYKWADPIQGVLGADTYHKVPQ